MVGGGSAAASVEDSTGDSTNDSTGAGLAGRSVLSGWVFFAAVLRVALFATGFSPVSPVSPVSSAAGSAVFLALALVLAVVFFAAVFFAVVFLAAVFFAAAFFAGAGAASSTLAAGVSEVRWSCLRRARALLATRGALVRQSRVCKTPDGRGAVVDAKPSLAATPSAGASESACRPPTAVAGPGAHRLCHRSVLRPRRGLVTTFTFCAEPLERTGENVVGSCREALTKAQYRTRQFIFGRDGPRAGRRWWPPPRRAAPVRAGSELAPRRRESPTWPPAR